jgi:glycosyltransferase involved in cell wall biosynthesis/GT2 family glycosyltransferase
MSFSVIIATLGRPDVLRRTIDSVARAAPLPHELIVVDGDRERSSERATQGSFPFPIHYMTSEKGLPKQRNAGIDRAAGEVILFIDDDVEIPTTTFQVLERVFRDRDVLGATARIVEPRSDRIGKKHSPVRRLLPGGGEEGRFTRFGYPRRLIDLETERDIDFMHGSFMAVRTEVARDVRFDEALPGYALAEDEDFSYRVSRRGRVRFVPELHVVHAKEGHGSRDARAFGRTVVVNRAYLFRKNFKRGPLARMQFAMLIGLFMAHRVVNREWAEFRGLIDGSLAARRRPLERRSTSAGGPSITFVSSHARPGGSERYLATLIGMLERDRIAGVVSLEDGPLVDELGRAGHEVRVIPSTGSFRSMVGAAAALRRDLASHPTDVVHANGIKAGLVTALARKRSPVVWVKHDFSFDGPLVRFVARRSDAVVGVSAAVLGALTSRQRARAHVVYTGVRTSGADRSDSGAKLRAEIGAGPSDILIGHVGRMHPVKGQLEFISAARPVVERVPEARIVLVGGEDASAPDYARQVAGAAVALGARVHALGHRNDIETVLAGLDVGVMTSHRAGGTDVEALPLTALEMLACGTPVVAYGSGGIPELLGDCGVVVPTGDVAALAEALVHLSQDRERLRQLSECGPQRVAESFSLEAMIERMSSIYASVAR